MDVNYRGIVCINKYTLFCAMPVKSAIAYIRRRISCYSCVPEYNDNVIILGNDIIYKYIFKDMNELLRCGLVYNHIAIGGRFYGSRAFNLQRNADHLYHPDLEPNGMIHPHITYHKFAIPPATPPPTFIQRTLLGDTTTYRDLTETQYTTYIHCDYIKLKLQFDVKSVMLFNKIYKTSKRNKINANLIAAHDAFVKIYSQHPHRNHLYVFTRKQPKFGTLQFTQPYTFYAKYFPNIKDVYIPQHYGLPWELVRELILLRREYKLPRPIFHIIMQRFINEIADDMINNTYSFQFY